MYKKLLNTCLLAAMLLVSRAAMAIGYAGDVIQIGTAEELKAFAELVNSGVDGANFAAAELTADIDYGTESTMIGSGDFNFQGCLDGKGHTIKINMFGSADGQALFRNIGINGRVKNLKVVGKITTEYKYAAGIAAWSTGTITNCAIDVEIVSSIAGDGTHAGVAGVTYRGSVIANVLAKTTINSAGTTNCGGVVGWADAHTVVENCLVINDITLSTPDGSATIARNVGNIKKAYNNFYTKDYGDTTGGTLVSEEDLKSGKVCFLLNHDQSDIQWTQTIGEDNYPVPFKTQKQVYCSADTKCDGTTDVEGATYGNSDLGGKPTAHTLDGGSCTTCVATISGGVDRTLTQGWFNPTYVERDKDGWFLVKTADDMWWLSELHTLGNENYGLKLMNDIDYTKRSEWLNINNWFSGYFDGQNHTLKIALGAGNTTSIIPNFSGDIYNVAIVGTIACGGKQYAGAVTSHTRNSNRQPTITNVLSDVDITSDVVGDGTHGGIVGVSDAEFHMTNCIFVGSITSETTSNCAGLIGWCGSPCHAANCVQAGSISIADGDNNVVARNPTGFRAENIYYVEPFGAIPGGLTQIDASLLKSGELAYNLNGDQTNIQWTQAIGTDEYPYPFPGHGQVYAQPSGGFRCDGMPLGNTTYTNTKVDVTRPDHVFNGGFCDNCHTYDVNYMQPNADGYYELATGKDLAWFSHLVTEGQDGAKNAILTKDIEMEEADNELFMVIARNESYPFTGHFDGQFHTISNLQVITETKGVGLIGAIAGPAVVENLKLDETCAIQGEGYVGVVGFSTPAGGTVTIRNVGNEGNVTSVNGANAGGVLGCCMNSAAKIILENCYATGYIAGPSENGALSGWVGGSAVVTNSWSTSTVESTESDGTYFFRGTAEKSENNYCINGTQVNALTKEQVLNGELAYKLNGNQWVDPIWYQTINSGNDDLHPETNPAHGVVYFYNGVYGSVYDQSSFEDLRQTIKDTENAYLDQEDFYAQEELIENYRTFIESLDAIESVRELAEAWNAMSEDKKVIDACASAYNKYIARANEIRTRLEEDKTFEGEARDLLEGYLNGEDEPNEDYPNGAYFFVLDNHILSQEEITAELAFLNTLYEEAVKMGYTPGSEITNLLVNPKFEEDFKTGWEGTMGSGHTTYTLSDGSYTGAESWSSTPFDMHQTVSGLKNGLYLLEMTAAARPSSEIDTRSKNYTASIYANGNVNYIMTAEEAYIPVGEAVDGETANITGEVADYELKDEEENLIGYMPHGQLSMAIAAKAGRAKNYIVANVTDGELTVGIKNRHSHQTHDWTGFANTKLTYLGEMEEAPVADGLDLVLEGQKARINTILNDYTYGISSADYKIYPNFSEELKAELAELAQQAEAAADNATKYEIIEKISAAFEKIYDCKQAYISMIGVADLLQNLTSQFAGLVEKGVISDDEKTALEDAYSDIWAAYMDGTFNTEEALNPAVLDKVERFIPEQDENGVYQIGSNIHMIYFAATATTVDPTASAVMLNDIDMSDVAFEPIGTDDNPYHGSFDGQGHKFSNLIINADTRVGLFGYVAGGMTLKNLILDKSCEINATSGGYAGIIGCSDDGTTGTITMSQLGNEGTVIANGPNAGGIIGVNMGSTATFLIENCYVTGLVKGANESGAITGWTGGSQSILRNCWSTATVEGFDAGKPFYRNDDTVVENCFNLTGEQATAMTWDQLKSGEITYKLNGSQSESPVWYQTLGTDTIPQLFQGGIVYYYGGEYSNVKPVIELNSFAYDVKTNSNENEATVLYTLNSLAKSAKIDFYAGETKVYTEELAGDNLTQGQHSVTVANEKLGAAGTEITYKITVESMGVLTPSPVGESKKFWSPYGMAINNLPETKSFGMALVGESSAHPNNSGYESDEREGNQGIYAFTPQLESILAADGKAGFNGGMTFTADRAVKTIRISDDGRLFIGNQSGTTNSPIYEGKLDDLNAAWTPVFTGGTLDEESGITYIGEEMQTAMMSSFDVEGKGEDLKIYTLEGDRTGYTQFLLDHYYSHIFALGTKTEWNTLPTSDYAPLTENHWTIAPNPVNVLRDRNGGLWYIQYRANPTAEVPALKHYNAEGKEDYSNINRAQPGGGMAINSDGTMVAFPTANSTVTIYRVNYAPNEIGLITMSGLITFGTIDGSQLTALAFDYANNLWVASNGTETLTRYVVPNILPENTTVTPSNSDANFKVGETKDGVEKIETEQTGDIYTIGGVKVEKAVKGVNIINGRKVMVK